ncbi:lysostaphin resistance A-like protein [Chloroflexota bacterium]
MKEALIYLLAITVAETVTVLAQPLLGIVCHILIFVSVIFRAALDNKQTHHQQLLLSLALVPLVRIISLSMPLANIPQVWWYPIIYVPLLVATLQVVRILGYRLEQIGLNFRKIRIQLVVALTGVAFGVAEYFILTGEAEATALVLQKTWLLSAFLLMACTGFAEELIFRGVLQRSAEEAFGWWGIVYVSLLFAIVHLIHRSLIDIAFVFIVALFFGWVVKKTGSLFGVALAHGVANIVLFLVVPSLF